MLSSLPGHFKEGAMLRIRSAIVPQLLVLLCLGFLPVQSQEAAAPAAPEAAPQRPAEQRADYRKAMEAADQKIADEVKAHSELMKNLEYLTTQIGPRLTGSPQMQAASEWTLQRFKDYGVAAHHHRHDHGHAAHGARHETRAAHKAEKKRGKEEIGRAHV